MFIPLNIKTNYCPLSSFVDIKQLITKSKDLEIKALGITDPDMYSSMLFYQECIKNKIKPIIGLELIIDDKKLLLYAEDYQGYQNLTKLLYLKQEEKLDINIINKYSDQVLCLIDYDNRDLYDKVNFKNKYLTYLDLKQRQELIKINKKVIYSNEVLFLEETDAEKLKHLYLIRDGKKISSLDEYLFFDNCFSNQKQVHPEDMIYYQEIFNLIDLKFPKNNLLPQYSETKDSKIYLQSLCKLGLQKRLSNDLKKDYVDRLKYELKVIDEMGFNDYFLVVYDYVQYAKKQRILVGPGRGSAAGSLVAYCLGITDLDPIAYDLLFERFLNKERITMPDIDIDFDSERREEVVNYVRDKYGKRRVMPIITFVTLGGKQAIRDLGRIYDLDLRIVDRVCNLINLTLSLKDNLESNQYLKSLITSDFKLEKIYTLAISLEGVKRQISIHAAGVVVSKYEIDNYIPVKKYEDGYLTGYSMEYLEDLGLLKMDFLGLRNLTFVSNILKMIPEGSWKDIPLDDEKTLHLFGNALTEGVFQFESAGMKNFLRKLQPSNFLEIVAANALFRPGPMANIDSYIRRKEGKEKIDYLHPSLKKILESTYGIIIYQEQIMEIAHIMADYSYAEADILRRAMSKKKESDLLSLQTEFVTRSIEKGYKKELAEKVYELILKFANYGFNKAHSVAYSLLGYKMAYLKAHFPAQFMSSLLTNVIGNKTKIKEYIDECRLNNLEILKPNVNKSSAQFTLVDNKIIFSLAAISNVGFLTANKIVETRKSGDYLDYFDFISRTYGNSVNRKVIESLILSGALDSFNYNRKTMIENIDNAINYAEIVKGSSLLEVEKPVMINYEEYPDKDLCLKEKAAFGFYFNNHPVSFYKAQGSYLDLDKIEKYFDKVIEVVVYVERIKKIKTKNNEEMAFITASDETGTIDLVLFPKVYSLYELKINSLIKVKARVEKRLSRYQLSVLKMENLSDI